MTWSSQLTGENRSYSSALQALTMSRDVPTSTAVTGPIVGAGDLRDPPTTSIVLPASQTRTWFLRTPLPHCDRVLTMTGACFAHWSRRPHFFVQEGRPHSAATSGQRHQSAAKVQEPPPEGNAKLVTPRRANSGLRDDPAASCARFGEQTGDDDSSSFEPWCNLASRVDEALGTLRHDDDYGDERKYHWEFDKEAVRKPSFTVPRSSARTKECAQNSLSGDKRGVRTSHTVEHWRLILFSRLCLFDNNPTFHHRSHVVTANRWTVFVQQG